MKEFKMMKKRINNISWSSVLVSLLFFIYIFGGYISNILNPELPPVEGEYATITREKYNFTIDYPTKWQVVTYDSEGKWYDHTVKLELNITHRNPFGIFIRYRPAKNPTLQEVSDWGTVVMSRIKTRRNIVEFPDSVNDQPVIRQRYDWGSYTTENVYIARSNDMIIISMQVKQYDYDANIDDFNAIVDSFRPFE